MLAARSRVDHVDEIGDDHICEHENEQRQEVLHETQEERVEASAD